MRNNSNSKSPNAFSYTAALVFFLAAIYHLTNAFPTDPSAPEWRHAFFAVLDAVLAGSIIFLPRFALLLLSALPIQQLTTHGFQVITPEPVGLAQRVFHFCVICFEATTIPILWLDRRRSPRD